MRSRAAVGVLLIAVVAGITGHLVGGHSEAAKPPAPPAAILPAPLPPGLAAPPAQGGQIIWLYVRGRWRQVPS